MASVQQLKKDISFLIEEVISDCYLFMYLNPDKKEAEAMALINEAVEVHDSLFERTNHPNGKENPKLVKQHYKTIRIDLLTQVDGLFKKISDLSK